MANGRFSIAAAAGERKGQVPAPGLTLQRHSRWAGSRSARQGPGFRYGSQGAVGELISGPRTADPGPHRRPLPGQIRVAAAVPAWPAIKTLSTTGSRLSILADAHRRAANIAWMLYPGHPYVVALDI
jgi:hypothetical protein